MSRERARNDNFYATALNRMTAAGQRLARGTNALIRRSPALMALLWVGSGWRTGGTEHPTGRALDVIASSNVGIRARTREPEAWAAMNRFVNEVLVPNAEALGIRHIIWDRRIYRTRYGTWGALPGRNSGSSVSDWHEDHAHILLEPNGAGWLSSLDSVTLGGPTAPPAPSPAPGPPSTGASGNLTSGSRGDRVRSLQSELVRVFPAYRHAVGVRRGQLLDVDGIFGAQTEAWVMEFQARSALVVDGIVGSRTRAELAKHGVNLDATPKPTPKPKPPVKSIATMAAEVIDGRHGTGHTNRRRSLGVDAATYARVRAEVNRRVAGGTGGKSIAAMASEVIDGRHGTGHANRRRSLGISEAEYQRVRAEVNRRV